MYILMYLPTCEQVLIRDIFIKPLQFPYHPPIQSKIKEDVEQYLSNKYHYVRYETIGIFACLKQKSNAGFVSYTKIRREHLEIVEIPDDDTYTS